MRAIFEPRPDRDLQVIVGGSGTAPSQARRRFALGGMGTGDRLAGHSRKLCEVGAAVKAPNSYRLCALGISAFPPKPSPRQRSTSRIPAGRGDASSAQPPATAPPARSYKRPPCAGTLRPCSDATQHTAGMRGRLPAGDYPRLTRRTCTRQRVFARESGSVALAVHLLKKVR